MALYRVFTMIAPRFNQKGMAAICASVFLLSASSAHAQASQQQRMPTIADCPPGYVLGVQDADSLMPLARDNSAQANPNAYTVDGQMAAFKAQQQEDATYTADQTQAPHAFVTGCVPPQAQPQQQQ